jgi:hypothetical protein
VFFTHSLPPFDGDILELIGNPNRTQEFRKRSAAN